MLSASTSSLTKLGSFTFKPLHPYHITMASFKTITTSCHLVCLQNTHEPIPLPDNEVVVIGRSPLTKIVDVRCSRNQVSLRADWAKRELNVTQLGVNNASVDGKDIGKDCEVIFKPMSTLFVVAGCFPHKVIFKTKRSGNPGSLDSSSCISSPELGNKRKLESGADTSAAKKSKSEIIKADKKQEIKSKKDEKDISSNTKNGQEHSQKVKDKRSKGQDRSLTNDDSDENLKEAESKLANLQAIASKERKNSKDTSSSPHVNDSKSSSKHQRSSSSSLSSSQAAEKSEWSSHEQLLVYTSSGVTPHRKIAAFDMDGTIIVTKSGKTFPTDRDDWKIFHPEVFGKCKQLTSKGFKIVFFTNQLGVARGKTKEEDLKIKIENVVRKLQVPVQVFVATHEGKYRKPNDGMWDKLSQDYNRGKTIDIKESIYVGDAAGREKDWAPKKKKDFSCSDRLFALNIGIKFLTPEEYFMGQTPTQKYSLPSFDPRKVSADADPVPPDTFSSKGKEIIVLVGFPACGKSHFSSHVLKSKGYKVVNRDELGTWQKCVSKASEYLSKNSVVIDNTNLKEDERARYIVLARNAGVPCRCFVFNTSVEHCRHNERLRQLSGSSHAKINEMVFNKMKSGYKKPSENEGFSKIVNVNFVPVFTSSTAEAKYRKFLLEK